MTSTTQHRVIGEFWKWFLENKAKLDLVSGTNDPLWDVVLDRLKTIANGLWFELSDLDVTPREFIITAEGSTELFPVVQEIVEKAPEIPDWKFIALKPPMGFDFTTAYEGIQVDPKSLWFLPLEDKADSLDLRLRIGVPDYTPEQQRLLNNAVLVILDTALGERVAAEEIQFVEICRLPKSPESEGYFALPELPSHLEWRKRNIQKT